MRRESKHEGNQAKTIRVRAGVRRHRTSFFISAQSSSNSSSPDPSLSRTWRSRAHMRRSRQSRGGRLRRLHRKPRPVAVQDLADSHVHFRKSCLSLAPEARGDHGYGAPQRSGCRGGRPRARSRRSRPPRPRPAARVRPRIASKVPRLRGGADAKTRLEEDVEAGGEVVVVDVGVRDLLQQRVQRVLHLPRASIPQLAPMGLISSSSDSKSVLHPPKALKPARPLNPLRFFAFRKSEAGAFAEIYSRSRLHKRTRAAGPGPLGRCIRFFQRIRHRPRTRLC